ncbi:hypothetical protein VYS60_004250 [Salmonella enterica]|nr:hypothetical protein [Salmonella enterica]
MKETFFDPDLEPEDSALPEVNAIPANELDTPAETEPAKETPAAAKRELWGYDIKTLLIGSVALIALLAYAFWPDEPPARALIPETPAPVQQEENPGQGLTSTSEQTDAVALASTEGMTQPGPSLPAAEDIVPGNTETTTSSEAKELKEYSEANRQAIALLNNRVRDSEKRLADIESKLNSLGTRQATAPQKTSSTKTNHRVKSPPAVNNTGLKGWRINTVYPGMAWITHNGSTWSVQPGDQVNGLTIRSIDAEHRIVITSKGVIRQGD